MKQTIATIAFTALILCWASTGVVEAFAASPAFSSASVIASQRPTPITTAFLQRRGRQEEAATNHPQWTTTSTRFSNPSDSDGDPPATEGRERDNPDDPKSEHQQSSNTNQKKGYQRAEDWEAEQKERKANGEMTWEERVQFEGLRQGNQFRQNQILSHHLGRM